ncbi:IclR family transcriptional regulator [Rhizorhabdus dicambivorans]|nr:IclR family transcriptional regulator [Rhizorhabdus dicambivorans]
MDEDEQSPSSRDCGGVQSVEVAGAILNAFVEAQRPVNLTEIAKIAGMHPAKMHRYLASLMRTQLIEQDPSTGRFRPGPLTIPLAFGRLRNLNVISCAAPILADLRDATGETAMMSIWTENGPVVMRLEESARPVFLNVRVGSTLPLYHTAAGRAFAANKSAVQIRDVAEPPPFWTDDLAAKIRADGVAALSDALVRGVNAIAAPVMDAFDNVAAVIGVVGHEQFLDIAVDGPTAEKLKAAARQFSRALGNMH